MSKITEAERYLLDLVRKGDSDGWYQLVNRYEGRLLAFARRQTAHVSDAEDAVQDTFLSFLESLPRFRETSGLETYLFAILRRKTADLFRTRPVNVCSLQDHEPNQHLTTHSTDTPQHIAPDLSASTYAIHQEERSLLHAQLEIALRNVLIELKDTLDFERIRLMELLFYAQLRNKEIAQRVGQTEQHVALQKHRFLQKLTPSASQAQQNSTSELEGILTQVWEELRPSCPKRSTIGAWTLGSLDPEWSNYIHFHIKELGCRFCQANQEDLEIASKENGASRLRKRIMQSTIGFFNGP